MKNGKLIIASLVVLFGFLIQCKEKPIETSPDNYDRKGLLTNMAANYIVPAYANFQNQTSKLKALVIIFMDDLNEPNLENCQNQWKKTALAWQDIAMIEFGPAESVSLRSQINIYPTDTILIKSNISTGMYDLQLPSNFDAKGLQALDYLLFLPAFSNEEIVTYYIDNENAKSYIYSLVNELNTLATNVHYEWNYTYINTFISNNESNATGSSIGIMVNALSLHYEAFVRKGKVAIPLGVFNGISKEIMPSHVEGFYSDYSIDLALNEMEALLNYVNGVSYTSSTNGEGLDDYLDFVGAKKSGKNLSLAITEKINAIKTSINATGTSLKNAIVDNNSSVHTLYESMQQLVPLLKVDMTSAMGVLISYSDSDGD